MELMAIWIAQAVMAALIAGVKGRFVAAFLLLALAIPAVGLGIVLWLKRKVQVASPPSLICSECGRVYPSSSLKCTHCVSLAPSS